MKSRLFPILWIVSFAAALMPFAAYEAEAFLLALLTLAATMSFVILKGRLTENAAAIDVGFLAPLFAFWVLAFLSVVLSEAPYASYLYFCFLSVFPLSLCCTLLAHDKQRFFTIAGWGLAAIFAALSLVSLVQFFAFPGSLMFGRVHWPFADPNSLGGLLLPGFFCSVGLMIAAKDRVQSNLGLLLSILIFGGMIVSGSRGSIVALIVGFVLFAVLAFPHFRKHKKCSIILAIAALALIGASQFMGPPTAESTSSRITATITGDMPVLWERPEIWLSTWEIIKDHFWTGTGIGTFYLYYSEYRGADRHSAGRMAHSDPLQFWSEMGVFAPVLFYLLVGIAVVLTMRALRNIPRDDDRRIYILAPFCGLGALVLNAHISFLFYVLSVLMVTGVLMGFWFWQVRKAAATEFAGLKMLRLPERSAFKVLLIVPLLAAAYGFLILQSGHIIGTRAGTHLFAGQPENFVDDVNKAGRVSLQHDAATLIYAVNVPLAFLEDPARKLSPQQVMMYVEQGNGYLAQAWELNPRLAAIPFLQAVLIGKALERGAQPEDRREKLLLQSLKINPLYFPARVDLAQLYIARYETDKAWDVVLEGLSWREADIPPLKYYELLARLAAEKKDANMRTFALERMTDHPEIRGNLAKYK